MGGAVMGAAHREQVFKRVRAAFGTQLDVMHIYEPCISAAGHATAPVVAEQHGPAQGGSYRLLRAGGSGARRAHVGAVPGNARCAAVVVVGESASERQAVLRSLAVGRARIPGRR
jgi:hypothetical protein